MVRTAKRKRKHFSAYNYSQGPKRFSNGNNDYWTANKDIHAAETHHNSHSSNYATYSRNRYSYKKKPFKKHKYSRSSSPVLGSAEHTAKKIQETSAIIMRHLLNPEESVIPLDDSLEADKANTESPETVVDEASAKKCDPKPKDCQKAKKKISYKMDEIYKKITNHLGKLAQGRKRNLINSDSSGYDLAIQQIMKQKRLEISRTLRNLCHKSSYSKDIKSSVNPDVGIRLEDLPQELIAELRGVLNCNIEGYPEGTVENCSEEILLNVLDNFIQELNFDTSELDLIFDETDEQENFEKLSDDDNRQTETADVTFKIEISDNIIQAGGIKQETADVEEETSETEDEPTKIKQEPDFEAANQIVEIKPLMVDSSEPSKLESADGAISDKENTIEIKTETVNIDVNDIAMSKNCDNLTHIVDSSELSNSNVLNSVDTTVSDNVKDISDCEAVNSESSSECSENEMDTSSDSTSNDANQSEREGNQANNFVQSPMTTSTLVQTDEFKKEISIEEFIKVNLTAVPKTLQSTVDQMLQIDSWIFQLTKYRQQLFENIDSFSSSNVSEQAAVEGHVQKKRKCNFEGNKKDIVKRNTPKSRKKCNKTTFEFLEIGDPVLALKKFGNKLMAGTEKGQVLVLSMADGHVLYTLNSSHLPVTSIKFCSDGISKTYMFVASFDGSLNVYTCKDFSHTTTVTVDYNIIYLESKWGYIFVGCSNGYLIRYSSKKLALEFEEKYGDRDITVLKATQEGARRVLLVGSEDSSICIRDAMTGLHLRVLCDAIPSTSVYSIRMNRNLVFCGMTNRKIMIFNFHDENFLHAIKVNSAQGRGCMAVRRHLLFVTCHMEDVNIYNSETFKFIDTLKGPGGYIVSMMLTARQVIVGTTSGKLLVIPIPGKILYCSK